MKRFIYQPLRLEGEGVRYSANPYRFAGDPTSRLPAMQSRDDAVTICRFIKVPSLVIRQTFAGETQDIDPQFSTITDVVGLTDPIDVSLLGEIAKTDLPSLRLWLYRPDGRDTVLFPNVTSAVVGQRLVEEAK